MMDFEPFLQTTQDGNGIFHRRLIHQHLLESSFQSSILFDILSVFIQSRSTDAVQFPSGQLRLQQVSGIHGTFCSACTYNIMNFIDEQNDSALGLFHFV